MIAKTKVEKVIGKGYADKLDEPIFIVAGGKWSYSRRDMVDTLGCANFIAAVRLAKVLGKLRISSAIQLYRLDPASLARTRGIGESSIFVAMCILDAKGFDILKWWGTDSSKFSAVKKSTLRKATKHKQAV